MIKLLLIKGIGAFSLTFYILFVANTSTVENYGKFEVLLSLLFALAPITNLSISRSAVKFSSIYFDNEKLPSIRGLYIVGVFLSFFILTFFFAYFLFQDTNQLGILRRLDILIILVSLPMWAFALLHAEIIRAMGKSLLGSVLYNLVPPITAVPIAFFFQSELTSTIHSRKCFLHNPSLC